ncbi:MAG: hypothetical protein ACO4CG_04265 [Prochlorothrix sp.]|nr:hypothetical protein [Prochlorothrix sp.]
MPLTWAEGQPAWAEGQPGRLSHNKAVVGSASGPSHGEGHPSPVFLGASIPALGAEHAQGLLQQRWHQTWRRWSPKGSYSQGPESQGPESQGLESQGLESTVSDRRQFWDALRSRYQESHRAYHTLAHLADCFTLWDRAQLEEPMVAAWCEADRFCLEMSLWCHDGVYQIGAGAGVNEAESAQWAGQWLRRCGVETETIDRIQILIRATAHQDAQGAHSQSASSRSCNPQNSHPQNSHSQSAGSQQSPDPLLPWLLDLDLAILGSDPVAFRRYEQQIRQEYVTIPDDRFQAGRQAVLQHFRQRPWIYGTAYFRQRREAQARINLQRSGRCDA